MRIGRHLLNLRVVAVPLLAAALLAGCGSDDPADEGAGSSTASTAATTDSTTSSTEPAQTVTVEVYFVRDEAVAAAAAEVAPPETARGAIEALLDGPDEVASAAGMSSEIPEGTELLDLANDDGLARVDLSSEFVSGGGSLSMEARAAQVVFTLTQFDTIERVTFLIDGVEVDGLGGEGVPATEVDRSDFTNVTPVVLVTSPLPGEEVTFPLTVEGISNTFEATLLYELTLEDGSVVDSGFSTATSGTGTWGTFEFEVSDEGAEVDVAGDLTLRAFEESMEDGSRIHIYTVPLRAG